MNSSLAPPISPNPSRRLTASSSGPARLGRDFFIGLPMMPGSVVVAGEAAVAAGADVLEAPGEDLLLSVE